MSQNNKSIKKKSVKGGEKQMAFDFKIWLKKWGFGIGATLLSTGLIYTADYINITEFPVEYAFWAGIAVTVLNQIGNMIKHSYLEK